MEWAVALPIVAAIFSGEWLLRVAAIALIFGLIVFVHEAGHFVTARLAGMAVHEFSLGFGRPLLFWFRRGETQYSIRLWPFISYVRIAGMEPGDDHPRGFDKKPRWTRAIVLVAGCLMNFALAVAIFIAMGLAFGKGVTTTELVQVGAGSPAAEAGLVAKDRIVAVNGQRGLSGEEVRALVMDSPGEALVFTVARGGRQMDVTVTPRTESAYDLKGLRIVKRGLGRIGVGFMVKPVRVGVGEAIVIGFRETATLLHQQVAGIVSLIMRDVKPKEAVAGPVGIVNMMYTQAQQSWIALLHMAALLTVAVGFLNLLPFPPLDGSRLVILAGEGIVGRSLDKQKELVVHLVGMALLLGLVLFLTFWDVQRLLRPGG